MKENQFKNMHFVLEMNLFIKDHHDVQQGKVKRVGIITDPIRLGLLIARLSSIIDLEADIIIEGEGKLDESTEGEEFETE